MTQPGEGDELETLKITEAAVAFVVETPIAAAPQTARDSVKRVILDAVGVAIAASTRPIGRILGSSLPRDGAQESSLFGVARRAGAKEAARFNATMANALDFDEGFHIGTHVIPAAFAVAERDRLAGVRLLDAVTIGYEFGVKLTHAIDFRRRDRVGPTARGFWHVGFVGPLAAATAVGRLLRVDQRTLRAALGIASCSSGGFRRNMGTMAKALHSGNAARAGIEAVDLAGRGFTADPAILESPLGFLAALCAREERDPSALLRLGAPYALETLRNIKVYPACTPGHALIDAAIALRERLQGRVDEIESIEADLREFSLLRAEPEEEDALGFSGAYLIAAALTHGVFGLAQIGEGGLRDARVRSLMRRVRRRPASAAEADIMTVRLADGRSLDQEVGKRPRRLVEREEIEAKFLACAEPVIGGARARTVMALIDRLEDQETIESLAAAASGW